MKLKSNYDTKKSSKNKSKIKIKLTDKGTDTNKKAPDNGLHSSKVKENHNNVFGDDDDLKGENVEKELENVPVTHKLRMRNQGVHTPHACGPNTYNKDKYGITDFRSQYSKKLSMEVEEMFKDTS